MLLPREAGASREAADILKRRLRGPCAVCHLRLLHHPARTGGAAADVGTRPAAV